MDLDADLYGDLYETDIAGSIADEKTSESPTQTSKTEVPFSEITEKSYATSASSENLTATPTTSVPKISAPVPSVQAAQQIPTYEEPMVYRDTSSGMQGSFQPDYPASEHRSIRPSEMKDDG
ncbi:hypothetical protein GGU11DRAFT_234552 [Lentinula aff. detonsa]|nr:hypothetical protein GGU11DRAFT_234552 [Lentinula aff. detonsa]